MDGIKPNYNNTQSNTTSESNTKSLSETISDISRTTIPSITGNYTVSPSNESDTNSYIIALNKSSNVVYLAICTLIIGIVYILVIYLCSFIFIPINTLNSESSMFSSFLFNPDSPITIFNNFVKSKIDESFSNISENSTLQNTIADFKYKLRTSINTVQSFIQYWFNRLLLFFYINKNTINTTKQLNRTSFADLSIRL